MQRLTSIAISFLFCSLLYGQKDNTSWHLSGQTQDGSVKVFLVSGKEVSCPNALVYKREQIWDTLYLCTYASRLPFFSDTCLLQSIQMDGQGLNEIVLTWDYKRVEHHAQIKYTFCMIWDLDTEKRIFFMTPYYYRFSNEYSYAIDVEDGKTLDTTITADSCIYKSDFKIDSSGQIFNVNLKQIGKCPDDECWKKNEGIYFYENKKLQWKRWNNGG